MVGSSRSRPGSIPSRHLNHPDPARQRSASDRRSARPHAIGAPGILQLGGVSPGRELRALRVGYVSRRQGPVSVWIVTTTERRERMMETHDSAHD